MSQATTNRFSFGWGMSRIRHIICTHFCIMFGYVDLSFSCINMQLLFFGDMFFKDLCRSEDFQTSRLWSVEDFR